MWMLATWGWGVTGCALLLWLIRLSWIHPSSPQRDGMVCSMSVGTVVGTEVGVYAPLAMGLTFLPSALIAYGVGCLAGWAMGWRSGVRGVLEGTVAGWMGGTMGAMIAVMSPSEAAGVLFRLTGVLVVGIQFMVFLTLSPQGGADKMTDLLHNPWAFFVLTACFLLSVHFHPLVAGGGSVHGGY